MNKKETGKFAIYYALFYIATAIFSAYIPLYYNQNGFSLSEIGVLMAIGPILTVSVQPLWSKLSDKVSYRVTVLSLLLVGNMVSGILFSFTNNRIMICVLTIFYMIFNTALVPIIDTIATEHLKRTNGRYSIARIGGSVGYIFSVVIAGVYFNEHLESMFYIQTILYVVLLIYVLIVARDKSEVRATKKTKSLVIFKDKQFVLILLFFLCLNITLCLNNSYLSVFIKNLGFQNEFVGYSFGLAALTEVPILIIIPRIHNRLGAFKLLYISGFAYTMKLLISGFATDISMIFIAQMLQGVCYIPLLFATITYVSENLPDDLKTFGQGMLAVFGTGLGSIIGNLAGGFLSNRLSIATTYKITGTFIFVATMTFIFLSTLLIRKQKSLSRS